MTSLAISSTCRAPLRSLHLHTISGRDSATHFMPLSPSKTNALARKAHARVRLLPTPGLFAFVRPLCLRPSRRAVFARFSWSSRPIRRFSDDRTMLSQFLMEPPSPTSKPLEISLPTRTRDLRHHSPSGIKTRRRWTIRKDIHVVQCAGIFASLSTCLFLHFELQ
ncbi:hypothetical protein SCHPADRAFT_207961 [Schizopora paradoxa]|uniref:Uncharacterized protein n=1 Tax=Schizopora paradoxa TaxID=27342 RepID=A0A0H2SHR7_9AGAM|nr:hypothetical protein SCHPADRAFT_207961 [Schizopora paradoxa]